MSSATHSHHCGQYFRLSKQWCGCHWQIFNVYRAQQLNEVLESSPNRHSFSAFCRIPPPLCSWHAISKQTVPIWRRGPTIDCLLYVRGGVSNLLLVGYQWHIVYNGDGVGISDIMFVVEGRVSMTYCLYQRSWGGCQWFNVCSRGTLSVIYSLYLGVGY